MLTVFFKILAIFLMVAVGFAAGKKNILPAESNQYLVNLILVITSPCLIISSMSSQDLTAETVRQASEIVAGSIVFFLGAAAVSLLIVKALRYHPAEDRGIVIVIITAVNSGFMGFPITKAVFGDRFFFLMVIENVVLNFYLYFLAVIQMHYGEKTKGSLSEVLRSLLNPCTYALIAGLILLITGLRLPAALQDFVDTMANATIPLSMIVVGIQLAGSDLRKMIRNMKLLTASLCNVLLIPFLTFLAVNWLPLMDESKLILVFASAFPCAVVSVAVAAQEGKNSALMAEGVAMTTLLSMVTLPIIAVLLMSQYL